MTRKSMSADPDDIRLLSPSPAATGRLGSCLYRHADPRDVFALEGELGAGKTVFARGFIGAALAASCDDIPSPTFTLVQTYEGRTAGGAACEIWHF
ncbi:MAG: tRNA (adenosine(37)-N6)-threonylcarbamoyltransferase complex ATPase subunit type 1 TsaE, partial [Alphaproteobacteria bacterium]|nr:tRNA (adenosine(37)-N6)-threonylcarbamoyltransferase complex ATPase subunit type 1 TsaE [Alphaproteobacteria bacterium]